jgi:hypothetical protein
VEARIVETRHCLAVRDLRIATGSHPTRVGLRVGLGR